MNKLLLSAAITAVLFGAQAQAAITLSGTSPVTTGLTGAANTSEIWVSGSSAATPFVEKSVLADCSGTVYKYANGSNDTTWICNSASTLTTTAGGSVAVAAGTVNVVHKRDGGGSITGVQSAQGNNPKYVVTADLNGATCAAAVAGVSACTVPAAAATNATAHAGDIDLADVDPAQFETAANGGLVGAHSLSSKSVATQIFGVVVNKRLRTAMQVASIAAGTLPSTCVTGTAPSLVGSETEACMPSLTTAQLSAIFGKNSVTDWYNLYFGGTDNVAQSLVGVQAAVDQPSNSNIHYCSRTAGSGTLAAMNIKFENQCFSGNEAIVTSATPLLGNETDPAVGNQKVVHSMSGSGDLENCLEGLNAGTAFGTSFTPYPTVINVTDTTNFRWAIGIMGLDRNASLAKNYRFIKIDGVSPTAENVVKGKYKFWAELVAVGTPNVAKPLVADIMYNMGSAPQINALNVTHSFGLSGFLGTATNAAFLPTYDTAIAPGTLINGAFDTARPVNPYTHATGGGAALNHCRTPSIPAGAKAIQAFN